MMKAFIFSTKFIYHFITSKKTKNISNSFLNNFINSTFKNQSINQDYLKIEKLRKELSNSNRGIYVKDMNATTMHTISKKSYKNILKRSAKSQKLGRLLYRIVKFLNASSMVEIGTSLGISTMYQALGNTKGIITTHEGCPQTISAAQKNFLKLKIPNIKTIIGHFDKTLPKTLKTIQELDYVFFDGNHRKEATINYFNQCLNKSNSNTIFVFDDIYWSNEMQEAWDIIKKNDKVTTTIDIFFLGIVFLRNDLPKKHYKFRFY